MIAGVFELRNHPAAHVSLILNYDCLQRNSSRSFITKQQEIKNKKQKYTQHDAALRVLSWIFTAPVFVIVSEKGASTRDKAHRRSSASLIPTEEDVRGWTENYNNRKSNRQCFVVFLLLLRVRNIMLWIFLSIFRNTSFLIFHMIFLRLDSSFECCSY